MKDDAVLLMQCAHEIAHVGSKHALHRPLLRRDDVDLDVARAQCRRGLEADKLAPIMMARCAPFTESMIARQSASERRVWTCGWSAPGIGNRTGSAPVASRRRS